MSQIKLPNPEDVEFIYFYDLNKIGFDFHESETSASNLAVLKNIIDDFSSRFNISPAIVSEAFSIEYLTIRSTEDIVILYNNKGNDDVYRHYTNVNSPTFKFFFNK